jgi:hypothetical protein
MLKNVASTPRRSGRPRALTVGDPKIHREIHKLAMLACTQAEVAAFLGCGLSTLSRYLIEDVEAGASWEGGMAEARISLRRKQFRLADRSAGMAIWLGKQMLGQVDQVEQQVYVRRLDEMSLEELEWLLSEQQQVAGRFESNFGRKLPDNTEH